MRLYSAIVLSLLASMAISGLVQAQTRAAPPGTLEEAAPKQESGAVDKSGKDPSLTEKLKDTDGVLKPPPAIDPEIQKPPPANAGSNMPVIVPPGEPGGDPEVQPK